MLSNQLISTMGSFQLCNRYFPIWRRHKRDDRGNISTAAINPGPFQPPLCSNRLPNRLLNLVNLTPSYSRSFITDRLCDYLCQVQISADNSPTAVRGRYFIYKTNGNCPKRRHLQKSRSTYPGRMVADSAKRLISHGYSRNY